MNDSTAIELASALKKDLRSRLEKLNTENFTVSERKSDQYINNQLDKAALALRSSTVTFLSKGKATGVDEGVTPPAANFEICLQFLEDFLVSFEKIKSVSSQEMGPAYTKVATRILSGRAFDEVLSWAAAVAETFRNVGEKLQADMDSKKRDIAELKSRADTRRTMLEQQLKVFRLSRLENRK